jgi:baseplate J-like protein
MTGPGSDVAVVYLDVDDEITSAATRIRMAPERRLAIVLPAGSRVSTSRINFRLLSREASQRGQDLAIVAPEASTRALAASAGLAAFASVSEYEAALEDGGPEPPGRGNPPNGPPLATGGLVATPGPVEADGAIDGRPDSPTAKFDAWPDAVDPRRGRALDGPDGAGGGATAPGFPPPPNRGGVRSGSSLRSGPVAPSGGDPSAPRVRPRTSVSDTALMPIPEVREEHRRRRRVSGWVLAFASILIVLLAIGGVAGWLFLPTAMVTVAARVDPVGPLQFTVRADPLEVTTDLATGVVPAEVVTFDLSVADEFPASGKRVSETRATGAVEWTNCDPTRSYTIPSGTIVKTSGGEQFATGDGVFLPVAILSGSPPSISCQSRDVAITARSPGTEGNVAAGTITDVPSDYNSVVIRVLNPNPTTGGTHTESKIVAQKDVDAALATLSKALRDEFTAQLADPRKAPPGLTLFPGTRSMSSGDPTVPPDSLVGQAAPTFTLKLVATGTATAVDPALVQAVGDQRIRAAVAADKALVKGSVDVRVGAPHVDGSAVLFPVTARASEVNSPDAGAIRRTVKGMPVDEARERLRDYGDATVDVWPGWVTTITSYDFRLDVKVVSDVPTEPITPDPSASPSVVPLPLPSAAPSGAAGTPSAAPSASGAGASPKASTRARPTASAAPSST